MSHCETVTMTYRLSSVKRRQFYSIPVVFNDRVERSGKGVRGREGREELKILTFRADAFIRETLLRRERLRIVKLTRSTYN